MEAVKQQNFVIEFLEPKEIFSTACFKGISPLIYDVKEESWRNLTIDFIDNENENITKDLMNHLGNKGDMIRFNLKKLNAIGEVILTLNIVGHILKCNFGAFRYFKTDVMGLEYSTTNDIEITLKVYVVDIE
jgi:hypothetical protein